MKFQSISPILPNFFMFSVMHGGPTRIVPRGQDLL